MKRSSDMPKVKCLVAVVLVLAALDVASPPVLRGEGPGGAADADWLMDGGDAQRTGWQKSESRINKSSVHSMRMLWKIQTGNQPRGLHSLMPVLVVGRLKTAQGVREVGVVSGISDNLYAFDAQSGRILWQKHYTYKDATSGDPAHVNFLAPGGSSATPVIGEEDSAGRRPVYFLAGDGMVHIVNLSDGEELQAPFMFKRNKAWALALDDDVLWMAQGGSISAVAVSGFSHSFYVARSTVLAPALGRYIPAGTMSFAVGSAGPWGRRGVALDSTGTAWAATADSTYDPSNGRYGSSIVGVRISGSTLQLKDHYAPSNWQWLLKRDLDLSATPTVFEYKGRELLAAAGKECRVYLLDTKSPGGASHQIPLDRTAAFCNEEADMQNSGSWGALSTWADPAGTRWVLVPFWGPLHSKMQFPISNGPVVDGGVAAFRVEDAGGRVRLTPAWVSRDMKRGEPVVIANGVVFGYGSGEETQQVFTDAPRIKFDSSIRAARGTHATIYALDAQTGKELWSSGDSIHQWNHFSGLTVANGRVYLGTYDGTLYCFGIG
jgi:outer membrane protein assembly factor BamB